MDDSDLIGHQGEAVIDRAGEKLGRLEEIYLDSVTNRREWALVELDTRRKRRTFVPLIGASRAGDRIQVAYERKIVLNAPTGDPSRGISPSRNLPGHYGLITAGGPRKYP